ncbi:sensor histidine kinase [Celerinatantimonas diazotrophica]|uniref:histidine kinase n=1 Tax=Celerinatantimonas diazotrophica TaxID=412034 RepID=A0A4R1K1N9_9GAMM|nr:HAMP domain-containing sensor histidine kinase [Celerinatantimonas diazotrophica]TCK57895.1 signal transduction histidine kinase [Celerinatantimonas diazotrophica]CAG9298037.1 Adaptive-response sensory-kinase SasA [Celerinatantimonas diazotrophica]
MGKWYQRQKLIHQIALVILVGFAISFFLTLYLLSYDKSQRFHQLSISGALARIVSVSEMLEKTPDNLHDSILSASRSSDLHLSLSRSPRISAHDGTSPTAQRLLSQLHSSGIQQVRLSFVNQPQRPMMNLPYQQMQSMHQSMMGANNIRPNRSSMMPRQSMMGAGSNRAEHKGSGNHYRRFANAAAYSATINGSVQLSNGQWLNFSSGIENKITHWSTSVLIALITMMLITVLLSLFIIHRALKPIRELGQAAQSFAKHKQVNEVSNNAPLDLAPTISAFNNMQHQVTDYIAERTKLLAAISHDLRTPLTSLRLRLEFIEDSEDKQQMLTTLATLEKMLTETMRFAKNDTQKEARQMTKIDSLLQTIVDEYDEKGIVISYPKPAAFSASIAPVNVRRMIENLINNAIQYAGNNATIALDAKKNHNQLIICVSDDGIGIPEEKFDDVLKPFTRLNEARDTQSSNIGLGLSITQSLASAYGGQLILEPNEPHGLKATITIALS